MLTRYARAFKHWNYTTACCFKYKTHCENCPNHIVCKLYADKSENTYKIHPVKFAMLMTYANVGIEGAEEELTKGWKSIELDNKVFMKREEFWDL